MHICFKVTLKDCNEKPIWSLFYLFEEYSVHDPLAGVLGVQEGESSPVVGALPKGVALIAGETDVRVQI